MKRLISSGLCVLALGLATWASQSADNGKAKDEPPSSSAIPANFGPIHPRISPDGKQIAFSYQGAIWRIARGGGTMTRLTDGTGFDIEPAWSPDSKRIAYVNSPGMYGGSIKLIDAETGAALPVATTATVVDAASYAKIAFHPDGRLAGNLRFTNQGPALGIVDIAGEKPTPLARPPRIARHALSPDGKQLAYSQAMDKDGQQWGNDGSECDIFKIPISGGEASKIVRFPSRIHDMCWSANGRDLFVVTDLGGVHYDLWQVPVGDPERGARRITFGQADEDRPSASADGRWLVYTDNQRGATVITVRNLETGVDGALEVGAMDFREPTGTLTLTSRDAKTGKPATARVVIQHEGGKHFAPPGLLYRTIGNYMHFYCEGSATLTLPAGAYTMRGFHGPEFRPIRRRFTVAADGTAAETIDLERWFDAPAAGWHSGENHIHANYGYGHWYNSPATMLAQCAGEDLRVCNFMVANSDTDGVFDREYFRGRPDPLSTADTVLYWNQEFRSTSWGHMTLVNLTRLVEPIFTGFERTTNPFDVPTNADIADRTHWQKGHVNYTHSAQDPKDPYNGAYTAKGIPVDVALGKIDTIDLNASYGGTVPLWHRLLNCGFRLPPSAGTDCFLNRIASVLPGRDRVYVKINGPFSYQAWIDGLRAGRTFVTNGPMLELAVEDKGPGDVLELPAGRPVRIVAKALSQFPLSSVELIFNGNVVARGKLAADALSGVIEASIPMERSGWFSLRAVGPGHADHPSSLEAHAAPVYVLVGGQPIGSRDDAVYFLKWIDRLAVDLRARDRVPTAEHRQHILNQLEAARKVYSQFAERAN